MPVDRKRTAGCAGLGNVAFEAVDLAGAYLPMAWLATRLGASVRRAGPEAAGSAA